MRILVLGGYGFIGAEITRTLAGAGFDVTGLGRNASFGARILPQAKWIGADLAGLTSVASWAPRLVGVDAVVNAAGALQDGARDNLAAVHDASISACIDACQSAGVKIFVQISAPGASKDAATAFMRTKAGADAALRGSRLQWVIFKPGLVIGRNAYGGTALLRTLAGFPAAPPLVHGQAQVQIVSIDDVTAAVVAALRRDIAMCADYDLVEDKSHSLRDIVKSMRAWLGMRKPLFDVALPGFVASLVAFGADIAGNLGWRSSLRSTALKVMSQNVRGDPAPWRAQTGKSLRTLNETLAAMPATAQERTYAGVQLMLPVMILSLSGFWIASGVVALMEAETAAGILTPELSRSAALAIVFLAAALDIGVGAALLLRRGCEIKHLLARSNRLIFLVK